MIELREITVDNFEECILSLKLTNEQSEFIATNKYSLAEAYAMINSGYTPMPYAIYNDDVMVGFVMAAYQPIDKDDPDDDEDVYYVSRLMIDIKYQGHGYGKQGMIKMLDKIKKFPLGKADAIVLSCNKENPVAWNLYTSLGFTDTGEEDEDGDNYFRYEFK